MRLLCLIAVGVVACGGSEEGGGIAIHARADDAPAWAVPYGAEFWRPSHGVDVQDAIARVSHAFRGTETHGAGYTARVDGSGLRLEVGGSELRLRTTRVNGREPAGVPWSIVGDTAQGLLAPGIVEHYQAWDEGVEVSWVIAQRGAIDIEASVDGLALDRDRHFVDGSGTRVAKLGAATLIDHAGHRWPVEPEVDGSVVRYRVGADVIASAEFPVALDPVVGPELIPDTPVIGSAPGAQSAPSVASNGTVTLVVWQDGLNGTSGIRGTRVSQQGVVLDPSGIALVVRPGPQQQPRVASNGSDFLLTWADLGPDADGDVRVERVSASGMVLDPGGVLVAPYPGNDSLPAVASDGADYLVAWSGNTHFSASRVTAAGVVLDPGGFLLSTTPGSGHVAVASNGDGYLVVWDVNLGAHDNVVGTRVTGAGTVLDPQGIAIATGVDARTPVAVSSNTTDYVVAWDDFQHVRAGRVTAAGTVLDPAGITIGTGNIPSVASDGSAYFFAWQYSATAVGNTVAAIRMSSAGTLLDPDPFIIAASYSAAMLLPVATFDGHQYLVAWGFNTAALDPRDIQASRVATDGTLVDPTPQIVSTGPVAQRAPSVAASAGELLVAWIDRRAGAEDAYATRLSPTGVPLDPGGLLIWPSDAVDGLAVASNGSDFLVTWSDDAGSSEIVMAVRVASTGVVGQVRQLATDGSASVVASDGTGYLVAWTEGISGTIQGRRVDASGTVAGTAFDIASPTTPSPHPAIAWGGGQYLVAWNDSTPTSGYDIFATRVSATGEVLDVPFVVSAAAKDQRNPAVAASDTEYLVAWDDRRAPFLTDVYGTRVSFGGVVLDPAGLAIATSPDTSESSPTLASNGGEYLVAWGHSNGTEVGVDAARVATTGAVVDATGFTVAADATTPDLVYSAASAAYLVAYVRLGHVRDRFIAMTGCGNGVVDLAETCDDGGTIDGDGCSATCQVETGYACSGAGCNDIDECATNNGGCAQTCTNTIGGFTCSCGSGYLLAGDGRGCDEIDECATNNGGCAETCTNTPGSYICSCAAGYQVASDGHSCEDIDECATNNGDCTHLCTNLPGSRACSCHPGYMLDTDGTTCLDINECTAGTDECDPFAFCINTIGSHECTCDEGYTGDGFTCEPVTPPDGGCGCRTTDARGSWLLVIACLGVLRRRRR